MAKEKAKHDGLLCFLLALIVVLILVIGGGAYYFLVVDNGEEIAENNSVIVENEKDNNVETTIENKKKIKKINETKEIVYTIEKQETIEGQDDIVTNKIPVINLDYDFIKYINKEIESNYIGREKWLHKYDYKYCINENILSLIIEKSNLMSDEISLYDVYNIDIFEGTLLDNVTLLYELKKDSVNLIEDVKEIIKKESYTENIGFDKEFTTQQYDRTIYEIVNHKNIRYFLDDKGILNFIARRYNIAGGESTYIIYKLEK